MSNLIHREDTEKSKVILGLLKSVEQDGKRSQRRRAAELGIALGLVNAYLKRCVKKGLVKMKEAPAGRYAYYLTPQGFVEKSRLTVQFLSYSFEFFRHARGDCSDVISQAKTRGWERLVLAGASDLAEILTICALESGVEIVGVVDPKLAPAQLINVPVVPSYDDVEREFDGIIITSVDRAREVCVSISDRYGAERILAPSLLGLNDLLCQDNAK